MDPETQKAVLNLLPVALGGLIGVAGSVGGGLWLHHLKSRAERLQHLRQKLEELFKETYEIREAVLVADSAATLVDARTRWRAHVGATLTITGLHLPELVEAANQVYLTSSACLETRERIIGIVDPWELHELQAEFKKRILLFNEAFKQLLLGAQSAAIHVGKRKFFQAVELPQLPAPLKNQ